MTENKTREVEMKEFDTEVVINFVNFLYSDKIPDNFSNQAELLAIGHMYQVDKLVEECSEKLVQEISVDNFSILGKLAEKYEIDNLLTKCVKFVCENFAQLETDKIDSLPSSLLRQSLANNYHYMASFYEKPFNPIDLKEKEYIRTGFKVSRATQLTAAAVFLVGESVPIVMDLTVQNNNVLNMTTDVSSTDGSKPLKICLPAPVILAPQSDYFLDIKIGKKCVRFNRKSENVAKEVSTITNNGELVVTHSNTFQIPTLYFKD